jgi:hypothetical protein
MSSGCARLSLLTAQLSGSLKRLRNPAFGEVGVRSRRLLFLIFSALVFVAGCGGGSGDGGEERRQSERDSGRQEQSRNEARAQRLGSVEGVVRAVNSEKGNLWVKPPGEEAVKVRFRPENVVVMLDGEQVTPADIRRGQRATVEYVVVEIPDKGERNIARSIELTSGG